MIIFCFFVETDFYFNYRGNEWKHGKPRTPASINADYEASLAGRRGPCPAKHNSVEGRCIRLPDVMWGKEVLLLLPPDPLHHVLIGPPNTLLTRLLKKYPKKIRKFYKEVGLLRRAMYGGQCTGEQIKRIWRPQNNNLEKLLDLPNGRAIVRYLEALREVHKVSVAKDLCPEAEYTKVFDEFRASLKEMIALKLATHTPKCHIASGHFEEYFKKTGRSLYYADCSAVEAAHSLLRQLEEAHGTRTVHAHGSAEHLRRFKRSIVFFSSKNFGPDTEEEDMDTQEEVDEMNNFLEQEDEQMDIEEPVDISQYFVPIPDSVKKELEQLRADKDREIQALRERLAKYENLDDVNNNDSEARNANMT